MMNEDLVDGPICRCFAFNLDIPTISADSQTAFHRSPSFHERRSSFLHGWSSLLLIPFHFLPPRSLEPSTPKNLGTARVPPARWKNHVAHSVSSCI